jgi:hypothetical protein
MAERQLFLDPLNIPPEMVEFVAAEAERDADRVILFLHYLGVRAILVNPNAMHARFLLRLGAALRLLHWEVQGFAYHRTAGLPDSGQAIRDAFQNFTNPDADPTEFCCSVLRISCERFVWHGRRDLDADVAVDELMEDDALDAVADFLWTSRHIATAPDGSKP